MEFWSSPKNELASKHCDLSARDFSHSGGNRIYVFLGMDAIQFIPVDTKEYNNEGTQEVQRLKNILCPLKPLLLATLDGLGGF